MRTAGRPTLRQRRDHLVVRGHEIPTRLGLPSWRAHRGEGRCVTSRSAENLGGLGEKHRVVDHGFAGCERNARCRHDHGPRPSRRTLPSTSAALVAEQIQRHQGESSRWALDRFLLCYFPSPIWVMKSWLSQNSHSWSIVPPFQWPIVTMPIANRFPTQLSGRCRARIPRIGPPDAFPFGRGSTKSESDDVSGGFPGEHAVCAR